jgi:hypothetical protein
MSGELCIFVKSKMNHGLVKSITSMVASESSESVMFIISVSDPDELESGDSLGVEVGGLWRLEGLEGFKVVKLSL